MDFANALHRFLSQGDAALVTYGRAFVNKAGATPWQLRQL